MSLDLDAIRRDLHLTASDITAPTLNKVIHDLSDEVDRLRADADRERAVVLDYLAYRIEMSHYADAIKELMNARDEIAEGIHHTLDYGELLP
jgi:hypothetical protein